LTVAQGLRADGLARDGVDHADEIRRHGAGPAIEPRHRELVLEGEPHGMATELVEAFDARRPAQKALGGAAVDALELAREEALPALARQHRLDGILMGAAGLPHCLADAERLGGGVEDAALLDLLARPRRLAGGGDGAHRDAG